MRFTPIFIAIVLLTRIAVGQTFTKSDNETAEMFANRIKPDSTTLAHTVIATLALDTAKKIILAFYDKTIYEVRQMDTYVDHSQYDILIGYAFIPTGGDQYKQQMIDTIHSDGGDPEIQAVFFASANKDSKKELVVLCKYGQRHYDYNGNLYQTFIYKYSNGQFQYLKKAE